MDVLALLVFLHLMSASSMVAGKNIVVFTFSNGKVSYPI